MYMWDISPYASPIALYGIYVLVKRTKERGIWIYRLSLVSAFAHSALHMDIIIGFDLLYAKNGGALRRFSEAVPSTKCGYSIGIAANG